MPSCCICNEECGHCGAVCNSCFCILENLCWPTWYCKSHAFRSEVGCRSILLSRMSRCKAICWLSLIRYGCIQQLVATQTKRRRVEVKDPAGTAGKEARAMQQHLDRLGKLASLANTSLYREHKGDFVLFARQCRGQQCLADTKTLPHPAGPFLKTLRKHGMPVVLKKLHHGLL